MLPEVNHAYIVSLFSLLENHPKIVHEHNTGTFICQFISSISLVFSKQEKFPCFLYLKI
jgi:hypothetical protein